MPEIHLEDLCLKDKFFMLSGEGPEIKSVEFLGKITFVVKGKFPSYFIFPKDMYFAIDPIDQTVIKCLDSYKYFKTEIDVFEYLTVDKPKES